MYWRKIKWVSQKWDKYGFVNETEVRIATWIALVLGLISFSLVMLKWEFHITLFTVWAIWLDFILKIFIWPEFSIFWSIIRPFIKNKEKLWVWAVQKRFAWTIWLILSTFVMFCLLILGWYILWESPTIIWIIKTINLNIINNTLFVTPMNPAVLACVLCIIFMWFETVVWFCVWCAMYKSLVSYWIIKRYKWQNCINWACEIIK
jgi:hypothetical protein